MIFTSVLFSLFFLTVAAIYYLLPGKFQWLWLLAAGIFFYMYSKPVYILVPFFIILVSFYAAKEIEKATTPARASLYYLSAIIANTGILIFFKYSNFFSSSFFDLLNFTRAGLHNNAVPLQNPLLVNVIAPLGISYITFQAIGYLVEIKRGNQRAENHIGHFSTFLLFFPKIIAGPVERAHHFLPQIKEPKKFDPANFSAGVKQIIWGLFKKLVIADRLSIYIGAVLGNAEQHSGITLFIAVVFYVFQMYADFSGYTDMALGFAKVLGFDLMQNFNNPLMAKSVTEFWRKWHISLSTWFADYFYNPIAIARRDWGKWSVVYASFTTFIVLGFWHGANWTFIVFGLLQGIILTIEFFTRKTRKNIRKKIPGFINNFSGIAFTFFYFALSLIFFRAATVGDALTIIKRIFTAKGALYIENPTMILFSLFGIVSIILMVVKQEYFQHRFSLSAHKNWLVRTAFYCLLVLIILVAGVFDGGEFIYFQF